jgi:hypothetical protein
VTPRLVLLAVALVVLVSSGGCSAVIYHVASRAGHETQPQPRLSLAREQLDRELGAPIAVTPLPDGGQLATYKYRQPDPKAAEMAKTSAEIHWGIGGFTQGMGWILISPLVELVLTPMAIHRAANPPRGEVQFTISPDGLLLGYGRPPSYGPDDAAVEAPSVGAIRRGCWVSEERAYVECVASRFAVWSIE